MSDDRHGAERLSRTLLEDDGFLRTVILDLNRYLRRRTDRHTADEVLSEALVVLWRRRSSLPSEPSATRAFAFGVARRTLLAATRKRSRVTAIERHLEESDGRGHDHQRLSDIRLDMARALRSVSEKDRELILLVAWEGLSLADAAEVIGITPDAGRQRYSRARKRIREAMERAAAPDVENPPVRGAPVSDG